jgi:hypothetical protein
MNVTVVVLTKSRMPSIMCAPAPTVRDCARDLPETVLRQWGTIPGCIQDHSIVRSLNHQVTRNLNDKDVGIRTWVVVVSEAGSVSSLRRRGFSQSRTGSHRKIRMSRVCPPPPSRTIL